MQYSWEEHQKQKLQSQKSTSIIINYNTAAHSETMPPNNHPYLQQLYKMQQQSDIVLNFEEIFANSREQQEDPTRIENRYDETYSQLHHSRSEPITLPVGSQTLAHNITSTSLTSSTAQKRQRPLNLILVSSATERINDINRLLEKSGRISRRKMSTSAEISTIVNRLSQNHPKLKCMNHLQQKNVGPTCEDQQEDKVKITSKPAFKKEGIPPKNREARYRKGQQLTVFDHLYFDSKVQARNKKKADRKGKERDRIRKKRDQSQYLKNYIPFYERLESEVNRSQQKIRMIENGYAEGMEADRQPFQPKLYRSRYTSRIKSRYMSASRHVIDQTFLSRGSSVDSSEQGSLNKSREMVASVEEHFFKKMYCIFIEEDTEFVQINEKVISLLTQVEFQLLQDFIRQLDGHPTPVKLFTEKLHTFYRSMSTNDKLRLRAHETRTKHKYSLLKSKPSSKAVTKQAEESPDQQCNKKTKKEKYNGNYHTLIQHYI